MKVYSDYTEDERADLSREQVRDLLRLEMMKEGIVLPPDPGPGPDEPEVGKPDVNVYVVKKKGRWSSDKIAAFRTREEADRCAQSKLVEIETDYDVGDKYRYLKVPQQIQVETDVVYSMEVIDRHRSALSEYKTAKKEHDKAVDERKEADEAAQKCCDWVWEDWREQKRSKEAKRHIVDTWQRYLDDCEGDERIAAKFLRKAFAEEDIVEACELFAVSWEGLPEEAPV